MVLALVVFLIAIGPCAFLAGRLASSRGRSSLGWGLFSIAIGATLFAVEHFVWTRPDGDGVTPAGFEMQNLLPVFAMLGAAFLVTQLPARDEGSS